MRQISLRNVLQVGFAVGCLGASASVSSAALIAHWTMDDSQANMQLPGAGPHGYPDDATNNYDGHYYSYDGSAQFTVTSVSGKVGNAADFGNDDAGSVGQNAHAVVDTTTIASQLTNVTVGAWFNPSSIAAGRKWIYFDSGIWGLNVDGDNLQFAYHNGGWNYVTNTFDLSLSTWYYGAIVRDGTDLDLYLIEEDGTVHLNSFTLSGTVTVTSGAVQLGGAGTVENFGGIIDDVKVFNTSLTELELLDAAGIVVPEPTSLVMLGMASVAFLRRRK